MTCFLIFDRKYEEISPSHVDDFCYITDNTYTKEELVKMEGNVLQSLKFEMGNPTVKTFLRRITRFSLEDYEVCLAYKSFLIYLIMLFGSSFEDK